MPLAVVIMDMFLPRISQKEPKWFNIACGATIMLCFRYFLHYFITAVRQYIAVLDQQSINQLVSFSIFKSSLLMLLVLLLLLLCRTSG